MSKAEAAEGINTGRVSRLLVPAEERYMKRSIVGWDIKDYE
jgi:hypothetical protein